jgi:hypothetical protein
MSQALTRAGILFAGVVITIGAAYALYLLLFSGIPVAFRIVVITFLAILYSNVLSRLAYRLYV